MSGLRSRWSSAWAVFRLALGPAAWATNHPIVNWWPTLLSLFSPVLIGVGLEDPSAKHLSIPAHWWVYGGLALLVALFYRAGYNLHREAHHDFPDLSVEIPLIANDVNAIGNKIVAHVVITNRTHRPVSLAIYLHTHRASDPTGRLFVLPRTNDEDIVLFDDEMKDRGHTGYVPSIPSTIEVDPGKSFAGTLDFQIPWQNDGWAGQTNLVIHDYVTGTSKGFSQG